MYRRTHIDSKNYYIQPNPPVGNENFTLLSNPVPHPEYLYLSILAFLVCLALPNKQFSKLG